MGVCCKVFDIDQIVRIFYEFLKYRKLFLFFNISCFLHVLCYFQKIGLTKIEKDIKRERVSTFFFRKTILSHFIRVLCYVNIKKNVWENIDSR